MTDAHPRVTAYIDSLPAGIDSYPTCAQKGSIPRIWIASAPPFRHADQLPSCLRALIDTPPLASAWVPEVHANAIYLAICDEHFREEKDFIDLCYRTNVKFFRTPLYRALTVVPSATSVLQAMRLGWKLLRRGTSLAMVTSSTGVRIRLGWPPRVTPELVARCFVTSFQTAVEATNVVKNVRVTMTRYARDGADYDVSWDR